VSRHRTALRALLTLACLVAAARPALPATPKTTVNVFAAASLTDAFGEIAKAFERAHPGVVVRLNLGGSQQLAAQIEQGAVAGVFAAADDRWMSELKDRALLDGDPATFASNRLVVIVPRTNPARIGRLQDLARGGVKVVIGADAVPVGHYTRQMLGNLSRLPGFDPAFARRVLANVVSEEENVKSVLNKVQLGEADAGVVYRSDVTPALSHFVRQFAIPDSANVLASYPIAVVKGGGPPDLARAFVAHVLSAEGQQALMRHGLIAVTPLAP